MIDRYTTPEMGKIWSKEGKYEKWLQVEIAVCEVLQEMGVIPDSALKNIKERASFEIDEIDEIEKTTHHDVIAFLTNVAGHVGPDSKYIHMGMTSSDLLDTSLALQMREAGMIILKGLENLRAELKRKAVKYKDLVMVGRTHGVHAEPITLGLKFLIWYEETGRNIRRLKNALKEISVGKLSGAVGTFAHLPPVVEEQVCSKLGLKHSPVSSQIIQRDRHANYMCTLAIIAGTLEKIATEIRNLQRTEILEAEEYFAKGQKGSSAMPHKKNPITCERISGLARAVRGYALSALENISLWHERDITHSSVERIIIPDATTLIDYCIEKLLFVLNNLKVNREKIKRNLNLTRGLIFSQTVLLALLKKGLSREQAYSIVQKNAMKTWEGEGSFREILMDDPEITKILT
ncbi:MAG: adenylosuccinate lyase, partial [Fidelibacterota bacterium]